MRNEIVRIARFLWPAEIDFQHLDRANVITD